MAWVCTPSTACTGDPPSPPPNSPTCHWRGSSHSGSRTCACSEVARVASRGGGSRRVQLVIAGTTAVPTITGGLITGGLPTVTGGFTTVTGGRLADCSSGVDMAGLLWPRREELRGRRGGLQVEREAQRRQQLPELLQGAEVHGADLGEPERLLQDRRDEAAVPARAGIRAHRQQQSLRRPCHRLGVVERNTSARCLDGDPVEPFVQQQPGKHCGSRRVPGGDRLDRDAAGGGR